MFQSCIFKLKININKKLIFNVRLQIYKYKIKYFICSRFLKNLKSLEILEKPAEQLQAHLILKHQQLNVEINQDTREN